MNPDWDKEHEIEQFLRENCNRLTNGQCMTLSCMKRGGFIRGNPGTYDCATCPAYEIYKTLHQQK